MKLISETLIQFLHQHFFCRHKHVYICKFKIGEKTGQQLRLRPRQQFYQCADCGRNLGRLEYIFPLHEEYEKP